MDIADARAVQDEADLARAAERVWGDRQDRAEAGKSVRQHRVARNASTGAKRASRPNKRCNSRSAPRPAAAATIMAFGSCSDMHLAQQRPDNRSQRRAFRRP